MSQQLTDQIDALGKALVAADALPWKHDPLAKVWPQRTAWTSNGPHLGPMPDKIDIEGWAELPGAPIKKEKQEYRGKKLLFDFTAQGLGPRLLYVLDASFVDEGPPMQVYETRSGPMRMPMGPHRVSFTVRAVLYDPTEGGAGFWMAEAPDLKKCTCEKSNPTARYCGDPAPACRKLWPNVKGPHWHQACAGCNREWLEAVL